MKVTFTCRDSDTGDKNSIHIDGYISDQEDVERLHRLLSAWMRPKPSPSVTNYFTGFKEKP